MIGVARLIYFVFNLYALGLFVWAALSWFPQTRAQQARTWMGRFYAPPVDAIRTHIKPVNVGGKGIDFSPAIFLLAILAARWVVVSLLIGPF